MVTHTYSFRILPVGLRGNLALPRRAERRSSGNALYKEVHGTACGSLAPAIVGTMDQQSLRVILKIVVLYGERVMCNVTNEEGQETPITVTEYIVNDLKEDELAFHNPLHRQILTEAAERIHNEGFTAERYFVAHPDPVISKLSVELISNRYQLRKSQIEQMVTDEERLYELIPRLMINFKYAIVCEELKHTLFALQNPAIANDETQCNSIMERYNELNKVKSIMAKRLGERVILNF